MTKRITGLARLALLSGTILLSGVTGVANAGIIFDIIESGGNVTGTVSGSLNLSATQGVSGSTSSSFNGYMALTGDISSGTAATTYYGTGLSSWTAFGTGGFGSWDTSSGDIVTLYGNPAIGLAFGYVSGTSVAGSFAKNGASFASLGFTVGSYVSTLTNGNVSDTVTVNIGQVRTPEPTTLALLGLGLLGLGFRRKT